MGEGEQLDVWVDQKTGLPCRLVRREPRDSRYVAATLLYVDGICQNSFSSFAFLARRIEQLKQHQPAAVCTCGALERNDPQVAHPGRHSHDCPYRQNYRPPGQEEER